MSRHDYSPGTKWNRLTIMSREGKWAHCKCDCGNKIRIMPWCLGSEHTKSCGCLKRTQRGPNFKHGVSGTRLYRTWKQMRVRCKSRKYYEHVKVCKQWSTFKVFRDWAFTNGYKDALEIDRISNKRGYYPANCRWVTKLQQQQQQQQNKRKLFKHNTSGYSGVSKAGSKSKPWRAYYCLDSKIIGVGNFKTPLAAHRARLKFIRELQQ